VDTSRQLTFELFKKSGLLKFKSSDKESELDVDDDEEEEDEGAGDL